MTLLLSLTDLLTLPVVVVLLPLLAAASLGSLPRRQWGQWGNLATATIGLALACWLAWTGAEPGGVLLATPGAINLILLGSVTGLAAAWFSRTNAPAGDLRLYHAVFQILLGTTNLALLSDSAMLSWVALEAASLAMVLAALLPRSAVANRAAWRMLLLAGTAVSLAALGTMLLYLAATPALGSGWDALRWSQLGPAAPRCDGTVLSLAFVLLLLGYAGIAGLAPLQAWLLESQEAPPALTGVMGGAIPGVALLMILRLRGIMDANPQAVSPGPLIMALGLAALLLSAAGLWRMPPGRRWLALSSVGHHGIVAFAFGLGGVVATFAGMVHLTTHTLAKAAAFQTGGNRLIRGVAIAAIAGLPPFGLFGSLVLIMQQTAGHGIWLVLPFGVGIAGSAWALMLRVPAPGAVNAVWTTTGAWACLAGALALGLVMPAAIATWFNVIAAAAP